MPKPYEFKDTKELVNTLKKEKKHLAKWFEQRLSSLPSIVYESVGKNTFRAFHHMPLPPSEVYREWASKKIRNKKFTKALIAMTSEDQYDAWIRNLGRSFARHWEDKMGSEYALSYGPSRKLPNLLMKTFILWEELDDAIRTRLMCYIHIPLDSFSLVGMRCCIKEFPTRLKSSIPASATMSFVYDDQIYSEIQQIIREITARAGVPPIYFDVLAWNKAH